MCINKVSFESLIAGLPGSVEIVPKLLNFFTCFTFSFEVRCFICSYFSYKAFLLFSRFTLPLNFVFFEKATKFDQISILLLTIKFIFLCFQPNFEFSVTYSSSLSGAPWDPSVNYLIRQSWLLLEMSKKDRTNLSASKKR